MSNDPNTSAIDWEREPDLERLRAAYRMRAVDVFQCVYELNKLSELGSIMSMIYLSFIYSSGEHLPTDNRQAESWLIRATEMGSVYGSFRLGILRKKQGNYADALRLFDIGAAKDYPPSLNQLGYMFDQGLGIRPDPTRARGLWERAASMGHVLAMRNMAYCLLVGRGGRREIRKGLNRLLDAKLAYSKIRKTSPISELLY